MSFDEDNKPNKLNILLLFVILFVFLITLGILVYYIRYQTSISSKASTLNISLPVSIANSYMFASPVRASVNADLVRVTIFVLDEDGHGLVDKEVRINSNNTLGLEIINIQVLTDGFGRALFDLRSSQRGEYKIEAEIDGQPLQQSLRVIFD